MNGADAAASGAGTAAGDADARARHGAGVDAGGSGVGAVDAGASPPVGPDAAPAAEPDAGASPLIEVLRGAPTPDELAAVIAVVSEAYAREAAAAVMEHDRHRSAWEISARGLRRPLRRDVGWGRFSG